MIKKLFNKNYLIPLFFAIFLIILPKEALAWNPLGWVNKSIAQAIYLIPVQILGFVGLITKGLALLAGGLLDSVTSGNLIGWGYTNNIVVNVGLGITKQFVNLGIVVVLIVVSLLITLNYRAMDGKKILVRLILIALLVNFAPVLIGLIVDASNITMNYFLVGVKDGVSGILKGFTGSTETILGNLENIKGFSDGLSLLTQACVAIILNIGITFAFLILFFVFMTRYIMIWLLTILSPLAFVAWILPQTKRYFDDWWKQLVQWSIIGIPMAFFLYLAIASYQGIAAVQTKITISEMNSGSVQWFNATFPYVVVLIMIYLGFIMGLKTSAMGAQTFTNWSQAVGNRIKQTPKWAARKAWEGINLPDRKIIPDRFTGGKTVTARDLAGGLARKWDQVPIARWFRPKPLDTFSQAEAIVEKEKKNITGPSDIEMERLASGKYFGARAAAALHAIVKDRGDSQDFIKAYAIKYKHVDEKGKVDENALFNDPKFLNDQTAIRALEYLDKAGKKGKTLRIDPRLARIGQTEEKGREIMKDMIINMKPGDVSVMEREVADNEDFMEISMALKDEGHFRGLSALKGGTLARQHTINKVFSRWVDSQNLDKQDVKGNWDKYMDHLSDKYNVATPGIKKALENKRMISLGYEETARYLNETQRKTPPGTVTPASALGINEQPEATPSISSSESIKNKTILDEMKEKKEKGK